MLEIEAGFSAALLIVLWYIFGKSKPYSHSEWIKRMKQLNIGTGKE